MPHEKVCSCYKFIILVRHGQYETEADSRDKKVLTGWIQAKAAGRRLRELGYKYVYLVFHEVTFFSIDCIVHSDMIRARQTTAGILSEFDQMQLKDTGILQITNSPLPRK